MLNLKHAYSGTLIIWILIFIIFKIMPKTGNLRQSYKWINFNQFLGRKNRGITIVANILQFKSDFLKCVGHYLENAVF